jgi:hypothetical protein
MVPTLGQAAHLHAGMAKGRVGSVREKRKRDPHLPHVAPTFSWCLRSLAFVGNTFSQYSHLNGFSPVWVRV